MWTRRLLIAAALVVAFQAGRMMPAWGGDGQSSRAAVFAQTVDACTQGGAPADEQECKLVQGLIDKLAATSLERLGSQLGQRTEALRPEIRTALETAARQRLGDEIATLTTQLADVKVLMARATDILARGQKTVNRSEKVIDDANDTIDDSEKLLNQTEDLLDDSEDVIKRAENVLFRTNALAARLQEDLARANNLLDLLDAALPRR